MAHRVVLSTINDRDAAEQLARTLLQDRLVACVNVVGPVTSLYHWEGAVERDEEYVLLMKTTAPHQSALIARLEALHPYEVPEVLVLPVEAGSQAYLLWISASVQ